MKQILKSTVFAIMLIGFTAPVYAQSSSENKVEQSDEASKPTEVQVSEQIKLEARGLAEAYAKASEQLANLPEDIAAAEGIFDDMITEVTRVRNALGDDSQIASGVVTMRTEAEALRDSWQEKCKQTNKSRDCARIELWNTRVGQALDDERDVIKLRERLDKEIMRLGEEREYVIDDMRLALFDEARAALRKAIDETNEMVNQMQTLGDRVKDRRRTGN